MRPSKYQLHKQQSATMPNATFADVLASDDAEVICADLTCEPEGPIGGIAVLNRVIRYLNARRDGLRIAATV
jgi:hypothetical protein